MIKFWHGLKLSLSISLITGLLFSSAVFSVILYAKMTGEPLALLALKQKADPVGANGGAPDVPAAAAATPPAAFKATPAPFTLPTAAKLSVPGINQHPELPAGCEVTGLAMLIKYAGIETNKLQLAKEMNVDPTPVKIGDGGKILVWGNPNLGYVGDITLKTSKIKFGVIYHQALFKLLQKYVPNAVDLTGKPFAEVEKQIAKGIPVVVWTTLNFQAPQDWVEWKSPTGPVRTTFSEHLVLLTGYDRDNVYLNNPTDGKTNVKVNKKQFIATWEAMGKQALSYQSKDFNGKGVQ